MECTKVNCPMQVGTPTDNCGENCPWRTIAKRGDLISRAAACECIGKMIHEYREKGEYALADGMIFARRYGIKCLPAVDATPIIRCANCKWWNGSTLGTAHRCAALHIATTGEFYCAAAERKTNAFADQSGAEYADNPTV